MATTWKDNLHLRKFPEFEGNHSADIVIIGGGLTGILNAYLLSGEGKKVILLEAEDLGHSATLETTAFLSNIIDTPHSRIEKISGENTAELVLNSHGQAIDLLETLIKDLDINCEFMRCPAYSFSRSADELESLREEVLAFNRHGLKSEIKEDGKLNFKNYGYIEIPGQAKFHPGKFISRLTELTAERGIQIFEDSPALSIKGEDPITITTEKGELSAEKVIIATHKPAFGQGSLIRETSDTKNVGTAISSGTYRSYVLEIIIPPDQLREAIYWDQDNPYHYFRIDKKDGWDRMLLGGEDHKDMRILSGLYDKSFESLENYFKQTFPDTKYVIDKKWSGPIIEPSDGLALIGEIKPNHYIATGYSGNGMTYSAVSALLIKDLILKKDNPYKNIYDPKRTFLSKETASKAKDFIDEFIKGALKNILD